MSTNFTINVEHQIVFSYGTGLLKYLDVCDHQDRLAKDPRFRPNLKQLAHFGGFTGMDVTEHEILQLSARTLFGPGSRRVFVAASDLQFGLLRMFCTHRELRGEPGIQVFRDLPSAIKLINVPVEVADAAFAELRLLSK